MNALAVIESAREIRISLRANGGYIYYRPEQAAPPEFVEMLRQNKAKLLDYLNRESVASLDMSNSALLAWASELAEQDKVLSDSVAYMESPRRPITTERVSHYAGIYPKTIVRAGHHQQLPGFCWGQWTPTWWHDRELGAIGSLGALRKTDS